MAVRCCSAQVDPSSGGIQLDLGPELLQEGMRLQLHAFTREAARDEVSGTPPLLPFSAVRIPRLAASSRVLFIPIKASPQLLSLCAAAHVGCMWTGWLDTGHSPRERARGDALCSGARAAGGGATRELPWEGPLPLRRGGSGDSGTGRGIWTTLLAL
jgi:hypothetical protein